MSSGWDISGASFLMSNSNLTLTEIMDMGFVAAVHGNSSPFPSQPEQWDRRVPPKSGVSPLFVTVSESTPMTRGGGKLWLGGVEDVGSSACRSPLNPDGLFLEQSLVSESLSQFNNSIVGIFYGSKVSTPYKKESMETSDPLVVDITTSKLQDSEVVVNASTLQKPAPPMWEISEINSALEENTPSLEVSISDLRFPNTSSEGDPLIPAQTSAAPLSQWVGVKHKDMGRSYLQPFRYRRQLSASEIPVTSLVPPACSFQLAVGSPDKPVEWQAEVTAGPQAT